MPADSASIFIPSWDRFRDEPDLWLWFQNVALELQLLDFTSAERAHLTDYYDEAGLLRDWRRPFFRHHYSVQLWSALRTLFENRAAPRILDLGCGTGTQALLFALLGARVVGVDMDERALGVLAKRKAFYERLSGRKLDVETRSGNVFEIDFAALGPFTGVYSLFAFNMMQPSQLLLSRLAPHLSDDAVFAIQDGNKAHFFNRVFHPRRHVASRGELRAMLGNLGCTDVRQIGGCVIPPVLWRLAPASLLAPADRFLAKSELLAVSYLHLARRCNRPAG